MSHEADVCYRINDRDEIIFVDGEWDRFAEANDGPEMVSNSILGRNLWDFISDQTTIQLYQQMVARVRQGSLAQFKLRCDGPSCRRHLEMTIQKTETGDIEFATRSLQVEDRPAMALLDRGTPRSTDMLRACSWCNRIDVDAEEWMEVEDAVEQLKIFEDGRMPEITHGMCEACFAKISSTLDDDEVSG